MISARVGLSEAGKRIHAAGGAFAASSAGLFPDPVLVAAVQAALDGRVDEIIPEPDVAAPSCRGIAALVAAEHGLTLEDIISRGRGRNLMAARFEAYYRCLVGTMASASEVGARLGNRHHVTILSGVTRYCNAKGLPMPRGLSERHQTHGRRRAGA